LFAFTLPDFLQGLGQPFLDLLEDPALFPRLLFRRRGQLLRLFGCLARAFVLKARVFTPGFSGFRCPLEVGSLALSKLQVLLGLGRSLLEIVQFHIGLP
jgi:hypothetical protein